MSDHSRPHHFEEWFEIDPSQANKDQPGQPRPPKRPRPRGATHTTDCWKVPKNRSNPPHRDPRVPVYARILGPAMVVEVFPQAVSRLQLVLDLDNTLIEGVREDAEMSPATRSRLEQISVRCPPMLVAKRPGLDAFLAVVSRYYDLWVYSTGQSDYVRAVLRSIDPDFKYFRDRVYTPSCEGSKAQSKTLSVLAGIANKLDLTLILDDQPEAWQSDICVVPAKVFSPSGLNKGRSEVSLSTLATKFTFTCLKPNEILAEKNDMQLEHLMEAFTRTYFAFIEKGEVNTASYEFSEVRKSTLKDVELSYTSYLEKVTGKIAGYTRERYKLYHFCATALGATEGKEGKKVEEQKSEGCVAGQWLVQCFLHCYKL